MIVRSRAPLRLGLAGGGTDVSPYCDTFGGYVLNATIDRYAYAVIRTIDEPITRFVATDQELESVQPAAEAYSLKGQLQLHKAVYNYIIKTFHDNEPIPLELSTFCDAPAGSGLGSSSTLVVAMIKAFVELLNLPLDDYEIAHAAFQVERIDCGLNGGRQDQYSATFGGFNFMEFFANDRAIINTLRVKSWIVCELEASLLLYYTGRSRESAKIIEDQKGNVERGSERALTAMHGMKQEAVEMKEALLRGSFGGIVQSMLNGWESKKRSARTVSTLEIEETYDAAMNAGAVAGKVSGAGGGGFMMFFVPTESRMSVMRDLKSRGGIVSNCHFTTHGTQAWRVR